MAKRQNVPAMLGALWPGPGLMLITGLVANPSQAFGADQVIELRLSAAQAQRVQAFIARTLGRGESPVGGDPPANSTGVAPYATGPYEGSLYFTAVPRYSAFHTCNTWAAEALQAEGFRYAAPPYCSPGNCGVRCAEPPIRWAILSQPIEAASIVERPQSQGGALPFWQTTAVPFCGTTTVVFLAGGGGLLLLMQPASTQAASSALAIIFMSDSF